MKWMAAFSILLFLLNPALTEESQSRGEPTVPAFVESIDRIGFDTKEDGFQNWIEIQRVGGFRNRDGTISVMIIVHRARVDEDVRNGGKKIHSYRKTIIPAEARLKFRGVDLYARSGGSVLLGQDQHRAFFKGALGKNVEDLFKKKYSGLTYGLGAALVSYDGSLSSNGEGIKIYSGGVHSVHPEMFGLGAGLRAEKIELEILEPQPSTLVKVHYFRDDGSSFDPFGLDKDLTIVEKPYHEIANTRM